MRFGRFWAKKKIYNFLEKNSPQMQIFSCQARLNEQSYHKL